MSGNSLPVQIEISPRKQLEVRVNGSVVEFDDLAYQELDGTAIHTSHDLEMKSRWALCKTIYDCIICKKRLL